MCTTVAVTHLCQIDVVLCLFWGISWGAGCFHGGVWCAWLLLVVEMLKPVCLEQRPWKRKGGRKQTLKAAALKSPDCRKVAAGSDASSQQAVTLCICYAVNVSSDGYFFFLLLLSVSHSDSFPVLTYWTGSVYAARRECVSWSHSCSLCDSRPCVQTPVCYRAEHCRLHRSLKSMKPSSLLQSFHVGVFCASY